MAGAPSLGKSSSRTLWAPSAAQRGWNALLAWASSLPTLAQGGLQPCSLTLACPSFLRVPTLPPPCVAALGLVFKPHCGRSRHPPGASWLPCQGLFRVNNNH